METVALGGEGFETHVREGGHVRRGDLLITFDLDAVGLKAKSLVSPVVLTNTEEFRLTLHSVDRLVSAGDTIGVIESLGRRSARLPSNGDATTLECLLGFEHGLHARPAARVADAAKRFSGEINIIADGKSASARSAVAMMALDVRKGDRVSVTASGADRDAAARAVCAVLSTVEQEHSSFARVAPAAVLADNEMGGVCAVPGVVKGTAFRWRRKSAVVPEDGQGLEYERKALEGAIDQVSSELRAVRNASTRCRRRASHRRIWACSTTKT